MSANLLAPAALALAALGLFKIADFTAADVSDDFIFGSGWAPSEGHLRWAIGHHSDLIIRPGCWHAQTGYGRIFAIIDATPFLGLEPANPQRIGVTLNGHFLREVTLDRTGVIAAWIPPAFIGRPLMIGLSHLGARVPASYGLSDDQRPLAFAFHRFQLWNIPHPTTIHEPLAQSSTSPADLLAQFESLGDNCEFGLAQRSTGIEPLGLFRFTATPLPSLIDGLLHEFAGLGDKDAISVDIRGDVQEYILTENRWNLTYHTFAFAHDMPAERVIHREAQKLTLLKRRMLDDLRAARHIYIVKHNDGLAEEDVIVLFLLLNRFAANRLLYVAPSSDIHSINMVHQVTPGLVRGYIERFAPYDAAADFSLESWLSVCRLASSLL